MLQKLKERLFGKPPLKIEHGFFGKIIFMGGETPSDDDYWECELRVKGVKEPIGVTINAGIEGPKRGQVTFYKNAISNLDNLFDQCWPIFEPDFEQWTQKKFSGNWRDDFELMGIDIPKDASPNNKWAVCYFVDDANHYFTAQFENGRPKSNEIDG